MINMKLTIQHNGYLYEPPIIDGVQIEWERTGTPGKLTFTTIKTEGLAFLEGDQVCFYYDDKLVFVGYVFTKSRDKEHHIKVTCYDQLRYLKNKYTYVFENKTATQIVKALCSDFDLKLGSMDNTNYVIPAIAEENKAALDIVLDVLEETLLNTGNMFVLYDDCGKLRISDVANMVSTTLIYENTAENFDYSSSIDGETYNSVVLYYSANSNSSGSSIGNKAKGDAARIIEMAKSQIGTVETPKGSNNVKYNTEYYGYEIAHPDYHWCAVFVWWVFKQCGLSHLYYGGEKTASCGTLSRWFKNNNQWVTSGYQPGDVIFFDYEGDGQPNHVGIVESVEGSKVNCIEGNYDDSVARAVRTSKIFGAGRPAYSTSKMATTDSTASPGSTSVSGVQVYHAQSKDRIKQWGLLRYFEQVDTPSNGENKALALLKLFNKKTRELKVSGAFGDISVRGGTLIPVKLDLGDVQANNFMLVEKVTHKFDKDLHTMDLTLEGEWEDDHKYEFDSKTIGELTEVSDTSSGSTGYGGYGGSTADLGRGSTRVVRINVLSTLTNSGDIRVKYTLNGQSQVVEGKTSSFHVSADVNSLVVVTINTKPYYACHVEGTTGGDWVAGDTVYNLRVKENSSLSLRWVGGTTYDTAIGPPVPTATMSFNFYNSDYEQYLNSYSIQYYYQGVLRVRNGGSVTTVTADVGSTLKISLNLKDGTKVSKTASTGSWSGSGTSWQTTMSGYRALTLKLYK